MSDAEAIRKAVLDVVRQIAGRPIKEDQKLVSSGLIDSLSVLRLISLLEKKLKIPIPPETLQPEDFDDVDTIVATIERVGKPLS